MSSDYFVNPNLRALFEWQQQGLSGGLLEGSSRSGKTISSIDNIVRICAAGGPYTFLIIKETYNSFKTTLYNDFNFRLPMYGISSPFQDKQEVKSFKLYDSTIYLLGADSETVLHGVGSDFIYYNELLHISQAAFDQLEMRCNKFWWGDYNPEATEHWVYDKIGNRPDVGFLKTTFLDNPYISKASKRKILSYEVTPENIAAGTADDYMWNVYGLGLRSAPEGLVFQHASIIKEFPKNIEKVYYGMDFGFEVDPTCLVKVGVEGEPGKNGKMYIQPLTYVPTPTINDLKPLLEHHIKNKSTTIIADSASPGMISDCRKAGYGRVLPVNKYPGSITHGISLLKKYKIHLVDCAAARKEQASYRYRMIGGIKTGDPVDKDNHMWDAARYAAMMHAL